MPSYVSLGRLAQAPHSVPRERLASDRGGHGPRGLLGERVDPLPPPRPCRVQGGRVVRADRPRRMVPDGHAPPPPHARGRVRRRRDRRPPPAHVERRRRDRALPPDRADGLLLPERRGRRGVFVHEGSGTLETIFGDLPYREGDYVVIPRGTTYRFAPRASSATSSSSPGLIEIPRRYRNEYGQLLEHAPTTTATCIRRRAQTHSNRGEHVVKVRIKDGSDLRARLPPVRRRRLGRLRLPVDVQHPRLRADHRAHPHACRRRIRPSRAGTSSSARSARASSTSIPRRSRSRTTTRT